MARLDSNMMNLIAEQLYQAEDKETLASLRLVSRESNWAARPWLYRTLKLDFDSMESVNKSVEFLTMPQNGLARYVHEIVLDNGGHNRSQRLFDELKSILPKFPAVRRVGCESVMITHDLTRSLCNNPGIRELRLLYFLGNEEIELGNNGELFPPELIGSTKLISLSINLNELRVVRSSLSEFKNLILKASALKALKIDLRYFDSIRFPTDFAKGRFIKFGDNEKLPPLESLTLDYYDLQPHSSSGLRSHLQWSLLRELTLKIVSGHDMATFLDSICTMPLSLRLFSLHKTTERKPSQDQDWHLSLIAFLHCFKGLRTLEIAKTSVELGTPRIIDAIAHHGSTLQVLKVYNLEKRLQVYPVTVGDIRTIRRRCPQLQELKLYLCYSDLFTGDKTPAPSPYERAFQKFLNLQTLRIFVPFGPDAPELLSHILKTKLITRATRNLPSPRLQRLYITVSEVNPAFYHNSVRDIIDWELERHAAWEVNYIDCVEGRKVIRTIRETAGERDEGRFRVRGCSFLLDCVIMSYLVGFSVFVM